jgi:hypothetical protein
MNRRLKANRIAFNGRNPTACSQPCPRSRRSAADHSARPGPTSTTGRVRVPSEERRSQPIDALSKSLSPLPKLSWARGDRGHGICAPFYGLKKVVARSSAVGVTSWFRMDRIGGLSIDQSSATVAPYSLSFMRAKSYCGYTSLARLKKNSSKAFMARGRKGSTTQPKAICVK